MKERERDFLLVFKIISSISTVYCYVQRERVKFLLSGKDHEQCGNSNELLGWSLPIDRGEKCNVECENISVDDDDQCTIEFLYFF